MFLIGSQKIDIVHPERLPARLRGLLKIKAKDPGEGSIKLDVSVTPRKNWETDIRHRGGIHFIGRKSHSFRVDKKRRHLHVTFVQPFDKNQTYWFQRDLFGLLPWLSDELFLHSSALAYRGAGYVFCGDTGAGKSTLARMLSRKTRLINDELNWIFRDERGLPRLVNQRFWIHDDPVSFLPIAGVYLLEPSESCALEENVPCHELFSKLLAVQMGLDTDDASLARCARNLVKFLDRIPVGRLRFTLDGRQVENLVFAP